MRHLSLVAATPVVSGKTDRDNDEVEVVFSYGDYGPGGLTPAEATRLAKDLTTEGTLQLV